MGKKYFQFISGERKLMVPYLLVKKITFNTQTLLNAVADYLTASRIEKLTQQPDLKESDGYGEAA